MLRLADVDPLVVRGFVRVVERVRHVLARLRVVGAELLRAHGDAAAPDGGVVQVDDDFVAPARAQLVHQRPQDAGGHHGRGVVIAERLGRNGRRRALLAEGTRDAAAGSPAHSVVAGGVCELAELAVAAHLSPDKTGELGGQRGVVEAQLLQGGRAHVVHKDVCFADHLLRDGQTFLGFQVEGDPVLVGVVEVDGRILGVGQIAAEARTLRALDIAVERFDLQNFGAHFGQYSDGCGSCDVRAHLDHFDARKRAVAIEFLSDGHTTVLLSFMVGGFLLSLYSHTLIFVAMDNYLYLMVAHYFCHAQRVSLTGSPICWPYAGQCGCKSTVPSMLLVNSADLGVMR